MNQEAQKQLQDIIASRRSIKPDAYTGETLDQALIEQILASANWAPTHGYTEPWRFVVYTGEALKRLGLFLAGHNQPNPQDPEFNQLRFDRLAHRPQQASHVIAIAMLPGTNPKIPDIEEVSAVSMAVQNMWLTAHALNVGSYWSTGKVGFSDELRDFIGLAAPHQSMGLFYIGKPAKENPVGRRVSGIETKVRWEF
jgi:nitroreductase